MLLLFTDKKVRRSAFFPTLSIAFFLASSTSERAALAQSNILTLPFPAVKRNDQTNARNNNQNTNIERPDGKPVPSAPLSAFPFSVRVSPLLIAPTAENLRERILALRKKPRLAEPVVLRVNTDDSAAIIEQLAKVKISEQLNTRNGSSLSSRFQRVVLSRVDQGRLSLVPNDLRWLDLAKLSSTLAQNSVSPFLNIKDLKKSEQDDVLKERLLQHFQDDAPSIERKIKQYVLANPRATEVPFEVLLASHSRNNLGKYSALRGRNCFGTALGFHDANVERLHNINIVREEGHTLSLINNDEFAQALWLGYRELEQKEILAGVQYGDIVVFSDATEEGSFAALKHAAVHIAGDIYFHKPSKSASSPVEFVRWSTMARTWTNLTQQLNYRFFRRLPNGPLRNKNSEIAIEKILWSN
jgi:hypothetical protein